MEKEMIEESFRRSLFEPACGPYRNAQFLASKYNGKNCLISSAVNANWHRLEEAGKLPNVEEFSEAFTRLTISSLTDFHSRYADTMFH
jgi:hypothetical protein